LSCLKAKMMVTLRQLLFLALFVPLIANAKPSLKQALKEDLPPCVEACLQNHDNCDPSCFEETCSGGSDIVTASAKFGRGCYYAVEPPASLHKGYSFDQANANCKANGTDLASVHSDAENDFIFEELIKGSTGGGNHHLMWIGLELDREAVLGNVIGSSWTDRSTVDYGNPVTNASVYPWAAGQPRPGVVYEDKTHIYSFGRYRAHWGALNSTPAEQPSQPTNGYICKGCPAGWTTFNGYCYRAFVSNGSIAGLFENFNTLCGFFNSTMVSIHSQAENDLVLSLARATNQNAVSIFIGMNLRRDPNTGLQYSPVTSQFWSDREGNSVLLPGDYGYVPPTPLPWGQNPWAAAGSFVNPPRFYPAQPDNIPLPSNVAIMWLDNVILDSAGNSQAGRWDDVSSFQSTAVGTVCKFQL
jgi:hypothetical protein